MPKLLALALLAFAALSAPANALPQERFGFLTGQITDQQNAPLPGATITITNTQTQEVRTVTADAQGRYRVELTPGRYTVRFSQTGFANVERENVLVLLGATFDLAGRLPLATQTETVQVTASIPLVDTRSTQSAHNVTEEEFNRMPKARSFQSIAIVAPSVNEGQIEGGIQVNGASGAENAFTIDGITTNSLVNGQSRQNARVRVPAGSAGEDDGHLRAVRRRARRRRERRDEERRQHVLGRGAHVPRGQRVARRVRSNVSCSSRTTRTRRSTFRTRNRDSRSAEFGGSLGGPIVRDRLFFFGSYSPRRNRQTQTRTTTRTARATASRARSGSSRRSARSRWRCRACASTAASCGRRRRPKARSRRMTVRRPTSSTVRSRGSPPTSIAATKRS